MDEQIKKTVAQFNALFESDKDAIQVIDEIILPMRGEIVQSVFWDRVRAELVADYNAIPGETPKAIQQKDFVQPMGGFQIRVMENAIMTEGKGILMLHPVDYKSYMEKVLNDKRNKKIETVGRFLRRGKRWVVYNNKEYMHVIVEGNADLIPRPGDIVIHHGRSTFELEIPAGYDEKFLIDNEYYLLINNSGCSLYRPK